MHKKQLTPNQKKVKRIITLQSAVLGILSIASVLPSLFGSGKSVLPSVIMSTALLITIVVNSYNLINTSRILFLLILNIRVLQSLYDVGFTIGAEYWFVVSAALPAFLYSHRKEIKYILGFVILACLFWIYAFTNFKIGILILEDENILTAYISNIILLTLYSFTILILFSKTKIDSYKSLINTNSFLEKAAKDKENFLNTMSHEIRTPLNAISGLSNMILIENTFKENDNDIKKLNDSSKQLLSDLNEVLDQNRNQSQKIALENKPCHLKEILKNFAIEFGKKHANKINLNFIGENSLYLIDKKKLKQLLEILVVKHTNLNNDANITITVKEAPNKMNAGHSSKEEKTTNFEFSVSTKHTFKTFYKTTFTRNNGKNVKKENEKLKTLLQSFGTKIQTSYKYKTYAGKFKIQAKEVTLYPDSLKLQANENLKLTNLKILLVDDNKTNLMVAKFSLLREGMLVETAENGSEAVNLVKNNDYQLILMDLNMPILNGFKATQKIRTFNKKIPILAFTASMFNDIAEDLMFYGFNGLMNKPFDPEQLTNYIKNVIGYE
jgi:CheY-like chemotaxis protein/signal transduction histidine kinase